MLKTNFEFSRRFIVILSVCLISTSAVLIVNYYIFAWTEPSQAPPGGAGAIAGQWTVVNGSDIHNLNTGNVGIGTDNPQSLLNLSGIAPTLLISSNGAPFGQGSGNAIIQVSSGFSSSYNTMLLGSNFNTDLSQSNTALPSWMLDVGGSIGVGGEDSFSVVRKPAGVTTFSNFLTIKNDGKVGIGTPNPTAGYKLDVAGHLRLSGASPAIVGNSTLYLYGDPLSAADKGLTILANGDVGIGTLSPGQKLSVVGSIESTSGGFKFPDGTTQTTASVSTKCGYVEYEPNNNNGGNNTTCPDGYIVPNPSPTQNLYGLMICCLKVDYELLPGSGTVPYGSEP